MSPVSRTHDYPYFYFFFVLEIVLSYYEISRKGFLESNLRDGKRNLCIYCNHIYIIKKLNPGNSSPPKNESKHSNLKIYNKVADKTQTAVYCASLIIVKKPSQNPNVCSSFSAIQFYFSIDNKSAKKSCRYILTTATTPIPGTQRLRRFRATTAGTLKLVQGQFNG